MPKYLLGTDNGCTVAKAALFTLDGKEIAAAGRKIDPITPKPGFAEMDMTASWAATADSIREVIAKSGIDPHDIACVASAGHGNGLYLVDKDGRPVRNAISSTDARARSYSDKWNAEGLAAVGTRGETASAIQTYGPAQGLASSLVAALAYEADKDRLWIGGSGGIDRVERASTIFFPRQRRHEHEDHAKDQVETTDGAVPLAAHGLSAVAGGRTAGPGRGGLRP